MPNGNKVPYSSTAFANTTAYKARITDVASKLGLRPEVIYGALVEENHDYLNEPTKNWLGDSWVTLGGGLNHAQLVTAYNNALAQGKLDNHGTLDKSNVVLNDVGPFNIQIGTAYRVILDYAAKTPAGQDPLSLRQYTNDMPKLITDLMSGQAAPAVAGLVLNEAKQYIDTRVDQSYWSGFSSVQKDGVYITAYNLGLVKIEERRLANIQENGSYQPQPGLEHAAGVNHVFKDNATKIGAVFGNPSYGTVTTPTPGESFSIGTPSLVRPSSSTFVTYPDAYTASLKKGGTLSDIVALEAARGNFISTDDIKLVNGLQSVPDGAIPADTPLMIPTRSGDWLNIDTSEVSLSFNRLTGENTAVIQSVYDNTTVIQQRTRDALGNYSDRYVKTDNASGLVIEEITAPIDASYGSSFFQPAADNTLLNITTTTNPQPTLPDAIDETFGAGQINQGYLDFDATSSVWMPTNFVNGSGWANQTPGAISADDYRPGEGSLLSDTLFDLLAPPSVQDFGYTNNSLSGAGWLNNTSQQSFLSTYVDPLVLDLNNDGVKLTDYTTNPVLFDIDNDGGTQEVAGWSSAQDGIVVMDLNGNGKIDNISETLSEYFNGTAGVGEAGTKPYTDGFAALKSLDSNNDNLFNSSDTAFANVKVWVDANHDAVTDAGELKTLAALSITQINLNAQTQSGLVRDGNEVLATGSFVQAGLTKEAIAANFLANPNGHSFVTSGTGTIVSTQGGLSSYVATSPTGETIDVAAKGVTNAYGATGNDTLIGNAANDACETFLLHRLAA